jgi:hypothetical protein
MGGKQMLPAIRYSNSGQRGGRKVDRCRKQTASPTDERLPARTLTAETVRQAPSARQLCPGDQLTRKQERRWGSWINAGSALDPCRVLVEVCLLRCAC